MNTFQQSGYDVAVLGAGVVGLTACGLLLKQGFNVALLDRSEIDKPALPNVDNRALAITPASCQLLQQIKAWQLIPQESIGKVKKMQIDDLVAQGNLEFDCHDSHQAALAYIIEDNVIQRAVYQAIHTHPQLTLYPNVKPIGFDSREHAVIALEDGRKIHSRLLVGADGQRSWLRQTAAIGQLKEQYQQNAVVCVIETQQPHKQIARQFFFDQGILALLPMAPDHQTAIVWSTDDTHSEQLCALEQQAFITALQSAMQSILGTIHNCSSRQHFPLQAAQADHYTRDRVALIGDAAHSVHPLAGQGANLGLMDAAALVQVLSHAQSKGQDFGKQHILRKYERWRRGENRIMMQAFSAIKALYEQQSFPLPVFRSLGMNLINKLLPAKQWLMMRAMGLSGDIPNIINKS